MINRGKYREMTRHDEKLYGVDDDFTNVKEKWCGKERSKSGCSADCLVLRLSVNLQTALPAMAVDLDPTVHEHRMHLAFRKFIEKGLAQ